MRIVFMGTPDFAVPSLAGLLARGHQVAGVFTQPDKPRGRGHRLVPGPVKTLALERGLPVYQPDTLRGEEMASLFRSLAPEAIVVVAYGKLLPPGILEIPPLGCINVHGSLLPKYRGAAPIQWSVLKGEQVTGVTTMYMARGLDTGDILMQADTQVGENETAGELYDRLAVLGADLLGETLERLQAGTLSPVPQEDALATHAPMLTKELSALDFSKPVRELHNQIRGLSPWPCAETVFQGKRLKIYRSEIVSTDQEPSAPGTLENAEAFTVWAKDGLLRLTEVQYEGSRRMNGGDFLRGQRARPGIRLGASQEEPGEKV